MIWVLIRKFMRDTEDVNNIKFQDSAWQRAKQLEADINSYIWNEIENPHRLEMLRSGDFVETESVEVHSIGSE